MEGCGPYWEACRADGAIDKAVQGFGPTGEDHDGTGCTAQVAPRNAMTPISSKPERSLKNGANVISGSCPKSQTKKIPA